LRPTVKRRAEWAKPCVHADLTPSLPLSAGGEGEAEGWGKFAFIRVGSRFLVARR